MPLLERVENDRMVVYKNDLLESFDLPSLKYIHGADKGVALIKENKALCYVTNETFNGISELESTCQFQTSLKLRLYNY